MTQPNTRTRTVCPIHPGEMLREDFLPDYQLTVSGLSRFLGVSRQSINDLIHERRGVSPRMTLRLSRLFGISHEFRLDAQRAVDLREARRAGGKAIEGITPLGTA